MTNDKILEVKNLKQYFKVGSGRKKIVNRAIDDISFDIYRGEVFGVVGESGCGKTTTGRTIIKLYDATSGEIIFNGKRIGGGIDSFVQNIKKAKLDAQAKILELQPVKYQTAKINEAAKLELSKLSSEQADQKQAILDKKAKALAELNEKVAANPSAYQNNVEEINKVKDEFKNYKHQQKELIRQMKKDNAFKGELVNTMKKIQMIFQDPISSLNPRMTVKEIIAEGLIIAGEKDKAVIEKKVFDVLKVVGLVPEHAYRYPHEFSGGQRQRIGIARALIIEPDLLIADEPISALDVSIQAQVLNLLKDLRETLDLTILFIAHDLSVVKYFSDRIAVMYYGKLVELTTSEQLFKSPLHPYTKSLLSAIPVPDPAIERGRQRFTYDPSVHNYGPNNVPSLVEIEPGHFVYASPSEVSEYQKELKAPKKKTSK